ncbi:MAG TPA: AAA family ATPase [Steroidobacteraceae bacterium]|nr:AAA family ATPase [Steroidobacteraceae bacterium]
MLKPEEYSDGTRAAIALMSEARKKKPNGTLPAAETAPLSHHITDILARKTQVQWLPGLRHILERRVIAIMPGPHGSYKSAVVGRWQIQAALAGVPGMMLYGEGAGLDRRIDAGLKQLAPDTDPATVPLHAIEKRINLSKDGLETLRAELRRVGFRGGLLSIDTYSKYAAALDQDNNTDASAFIAGLDSIREEFDCAILLVTHTGHSDKKRARGASSLTDDTDAEYVVSFENGTVKVTRERFKDSPSLSPLFYTPVVVDLGRKDDSGEAVTGLVLEIAGTPPAASKAKGLGKVESKILTIARSTSVAEIELSWIVQQYKETTPRGDGKRDTRGDVARRAVKDLTERGLLHFAEGSDAERVRTGETTDWLNGSET